MTNLKNKNYWLIKDFAIDRSRRPEVQGDKLRAIYTLIQKKGDPIRTNDKELNGLKALQISKNEFIAMQKTSFGPGFFPCKLKTILLTEL